MKKVFLKVILFTIVFGLLISTLSGCKSSDKTNGTASNLQGNDRITELTMPITTKPITLTMFAYIHPNTSKYISSWAENEAVKEFMKKTGIKLEFIHPAAGQEKEQFNIMVASNDLPDMVYGQFNDYKGGPEAAIKDGLIIDVDDLVDRYAPNFKKQFLEDPEVSKMVRSDSGKIIRFGASKIPKDAERAFIGPMIRGDYLAKTNMQIPETIDEWYALLKAFKGIGVEVPYAWGAKDWDPMRVGNIFAGAYGVTMKGFFRDNNVVKFSPIEPVYKEYLTTLNKWYNEGLLDKDFASHSPVDNIPSMIMSGKAGAASLHLETYKKYEKAVVEAGNPDAPLKVAPQPKLKKGDQVKVMYKYEGLSNPGYYITTKCKYPKEAVMMVDAMYLPENCTMFDLGKEGVTYVMQDGKPVITPEIEKNIEELQAKYRLSSMLGIISKYNNELQYPYPEQRRAWEIWSTENSQNLIPNYLILTEDESKIYKPLITDIQTYTDEMFFKFIMGIESLDNFDAYVQKVRSMGVDQAISIQQSALDRYNNRK